MQIYRGLIREDKLSICIVSSSKVWLVNDGPVQWHVETIREEKMYCVVTKENLVLHANGGLHFICLQSYRFYEFVTCIHFCLSSDNCSYILLFFKP